MLQDILTLTSILLPIITAIAGYFFKSLYERVERLEIKTSQFKTEEEIRQIINDKIDPIREDIKEIRTKLDQLLDLIINKK